MFSRTSSKPNEVDRPALRLIEDEKNAFAVIFKRRRYIVLGPLDTDSVVGEMLIFGHELGHHICGHTIGIRPGAPHDVELEADRFAGAAARALAESTGEWKYEIENLTFESVIASVNAVFGPMKGSATHPPGHMRVAAVRDGWLHGSPCFARHAMKVEPSQDTLGTSLSPNVTAFDGNGSVPRSCSVMQPRRSASGRRADRRRRGRCGGASRGSCRGTWWRRP